MGAADTSRARADVLSAAAPGAVARAADVLRTGGLVAFPTETVYGLGADATRATAVARIYAAKGRPSFNPLIVHVASLEAALEIATFNDGALRLAHELWPGPLTLVLPSRPGSPVCDLVRAGLDTIAIRVPDHPIARALLAAVALPIAAPSANRSGHVSATRADHVACDLGAAIDLILDAGPAAHGIESTILDATGPRLALLRPGAVAIEQIAQIAGHVPEQIAHQPTDDVRPTAPGQLASHYAPRAAVRLEAKSVAPGEALLAFGPAPLACDGIMINLSPAGDPIEAAAALFTALRKLDAMGVARIAVMAIPEEGLGLAINDRLRRAAAPRP